jgi:hypothetical protein
MSRQRVAAVIAMTFLRDQPSNQFSMVGNKLT